MVGTLGGVNLFAGVCPPAEISVDPDLIHYENIVLTGTHGFVPGEFDLALKLIEQRIIDVRPLVSHTFALGQTRDAFDTVVGRDGLKVIVEME